VKHMAKRFMDSKHRVILAFLCVLMAFSLLSCWNIREANATANSDNVFTVVSSTTTGATFQPCQRKLFYAQNRYWLFYSNGTTMVYKTSTDGETWASHIAINVSYSGTYFSVKHNGTHIYYARANYYRIGTTNADGTISWTAPEQEYSTVSTTVPDVELDSLGYPWVICQNSSGNRLCVTKSSSRNGTWVTASGFPIQLPVTGIHDAALIRLASQKMYLIFGGVTTSDLYGKLWNGASFETTVTIQEDITYASLHSAVAIGDAIHLVYHRNNIACYRKYETGAWGSETNLGSATTEPVMATDNSAQLYVFWTYSSILHYRILEGEIWHEDYTLATVSDIALGSTSVPYNITDGKVSIAWTGASPQPLYFVKSCRYSFNGVFDESTGLLKTASERTVNVSAYFANYPDETFVVNGTYLYNCSTIPLYFHYDLGVNDREYWLVPNEHGGTFYIFNDTLTSYTVAFLDLAGLLCTHPYVEAKRYVNGTLFVVEKRKVDLEQKTIFNLIQGIHYTIVIGGEDVSYTFGDFLTSDTTSVTLTLRGVQFPKETLLTYKYVRIYATRGFANPLGNITITYQDTLGQTNSVVIYFNYKNGTNAYNATETADSFVHSWNSALNDTDYALVCTIDHERYGTYSWKQYFPRSFFEAPWGLDFLGILPFDTSILIPAFLILCAFACFSVLNAFIGAFAGTVTAIVLAYMGWIPIPAATLTVALIFCVLVAIIYAKRRVET